MRRLLYSIPLIVAYLEYQAVVLARGYVLFEGEGEPFTAFHGLLKVGENFSFYDVPGLVRVFHLSSLLLAMVFLVIVTLCGYKKEKPEEIVEPQMF